MSQVSDVSLANIGFSAFRSELNDILGALNTSHLGTSAPGSIAQGTMWIDTSAGATGWILKLRRFRLRKTILLYPGELLIPLN